jgi:hypothetical protein
VSLVVKRRGWTFVVPLVIAVILVSAVPVPDQPETAFNEIDTPVNQTIPVAPRVRIAPPLQAPVILPRSFTRAMDQIVRTSVESITLGSHGHLSPLSELLCTFLI